MKTSVTPRLMVLTTHQTTLRMTETLGKMVLTKEVFDMRKIALIAVAFLALAGIASAKSQRDNLARKHTVKVSSGPFKRLGRAAKATARAVAVTAPSGFFATFDTMVIDPLGVALQVFADGVDKYVAIPLQSAGKPFVYVGDAVYYVYEGVDKVGEVLAR